MFRRIVKKLLLKLFGREQSPTATNQQKISVVDVSLIKININKH